MVQLSHLYLTTGKTIAMFIWTFVGKVMSLFNMLSRLVIAFFQGVSFNFVAAVTICSDLEPKKIKSVTASTFLPPICPEVMGPEAILAFLNVDF